MVNQTVLIGRIARDLELRSTQNGREVLNFTIAVNRDFKNQATGEYDADFINCVAFNQTAKFMSSYLQKGQLISVVGRIQTRSYDNDNGQKVYVTEIVANNVNSLQRVESSSGNNYNNNQTNTFSPNDFMQEQKDITSDELDNLLPF